MLRCRLQVTLNVTTLSFGINNFCWYVSIRDPLYADDNYVYFRKIFKTRFVNSVRVVHFEGEKSKNYCDFQDHLILVNLHETPIEVLLTLS